ncbi:MAG TPA: hypothetical protein ENF45_06695 [Bacteroidetes bacterium]|nr:hypothetical protein [Bacteroidota bacterium]
MEQEVNMNKLTLEVPESLAKLGQPTQKALLVRALRKVAKERIAEERKELEEAKRHLRRLEKKYKKDLKHFEEEMPKTGDYKTHEDYVEWSFWADVAERIQKDIEAFERLHGVILEKQ